MTQELLNEEILARIFELEKVNRSNSNIEDVLNARIDGIEKHLEDKITIVEDHLKDLCQTKIDGMEKATTLATASLEKRFESINEFRGQLKDQQSTFFTRAEHELFMKKVDDDIRILRESKAMLEGKASISSVVFSYVLGIAGFIIGAIGLIHSFM